MQDTDQETERTEAPTAPLDLPMIDKLSLEYMINPKQFNRYMNKKEGIFSPELQRRIDDYMKYQEPAKELFSELLDEFIISGSITKKKYNQEIHGLFEGFMDSIIHYFSRTRDNDELNDIDVNLVDDCDHDSVRGQNDGYEDCDDDNVLFSKIDSPRIPKSRSNSYIRKSKTSTMNSFFPAIYHK